MVREEFFIGMGFDDAGRKCSSRITGRYFSVETMRDWLVGGYRFAL